MSVHRPCNRPLKQLCYVACQNTIPDHSWIKLPVVLRVSWSTRLLNKLRGALHKGSIVSEITKLAMKPFFGRGGFGWDDPGVVKKKEFLFHFPLDDTTSDWFWLDITIVCLSLAVRLFFDEQFSRFQPDHFSAFIKFKVQKLIIR